MVFILQRLILPVCLAGIALAGNAQQKSNTGIWMTDPAGNVFFKKQPAGLLFRPSAGGQTRASDQRDPNGLTPPSDHHLMTSLRSLITPIGANKGE